MVALKRAADPTVRVSNAKVALIAAESVLVYIILRLLFVGGPGAFPAAGRNYVGAGHPSELKLVPKNGYDGQFVYRLAIEPFTRHITGHGITFDLPSYRQQRILTALIARVISYVPGITTGIALIIVNSLAIVVVVVAGIRLADSLGASPRAGLVLALAPGVIAGLVADLTEPVEWAGVLVGILMARQRRWLAAAAAFGVAMLARETAAAVVFGFAVESLVVLWRARGRAGDELHRLWLAVPLAVESAWQLWLWHVWGALPITDGFRSTGLRGVVTSHLATQTAKGHGPSHPPLIGIADTFFDGLFTADTSSVVLGISYLVERIVLIALIGAAGWALWRRRARVGLALAVAWCVATAVALSLTGWKTDIQFLRATLEAWGLSILVLLHTRGRTMFLTLSAAAAVSVWIAIFFLPRV